MLEIRPLVLPDLHRPLATAIRQSVPITNTLMSAIDTKSIAIVPRTVPGLDHQIITATLLARTTCTPIVDRVITIESTTSWVHALASDLATTVTTLPVHFTNTLVLATYTTSTSVIQIVATGQGRPTAAVTTDTAQITFTVAYAMNTVKKSAKLATAVG